MKKFQAMGWVAFAIALLWVPLSLLAQENLVITTYYPSPVGSYREISAVRAKIGTNYSQASTTVTDNNVLIEGRLGIGTTTPGTSLAIAQEASYSFPTPGSTARGAINIRATTSNRETGITFSQAGSDNSQAGIYVHQDNSAGTHMYLATTNSYATGPQARLTILNTGSVGIGTVTPQNRLDVLGGDISVNGAVGNAGIRLFAMNDTNHKIYYSGATNSVHFDSYAMMYFNQGFYTPGGVGIGTTSPTNKLDVEGGDISVNGASGGTIRLFSKGDTNHRIYYSGGTNSLHFDSYSTMYFNQAISVLGTVYPSDRNLKKDIDYAFGYGLAQVLKLRPASYVYKQDREGKRRLGFIAQDVLGVVPDAVEGKEGSYALSYNDLIPVLVKAVQEEQREIEKLRALVDAGSAAKLTKANSELRRSNDELAKEVDRLKERLARLEARAQEK